MIFFTFFLALLVSLFCEEDFQLKKGAIMINFENVQIPSTIKFCHSDMNGNQKEIKYGPSFRFGLFLIGSEIIGLKSQIISSTSPGKYEIPPQSNDFVNVHRFSQTAQWRRNIDIYCTSIDTDITMESNRMDGLTVVGGKGVYKVLCTPCSGSGQNSVFYGIFKTLSADFSNPYLHVIFHLTNLELIEGIAAFRKCSKDDYYMSTNKKSIIINSPLREYIVACAIYFEEFNRMYTTLGADSSPRQVINGVTRRYSTVETVENVVFVFNTEKEYLKDICNLDGGFRHFDLKKPYKVDNPVNTSSVRKMFFPEVAYYVASSGYVTHGSKPFLCELNVSYKVCRSSKTPECADKFRSGSNCDKDISSCGTGSPCSESGYCFGDGSSTFCKCSKFSYGEFCEFFTCNKTCLNGKCIGPNICADCDPGWSGENCDVPSCETYDKCVNGDCLLRLEKRTCDCNTSEFAGDSCEIECTALCVHGVCGSLDGAPTCLCEEGFIGKFCSEQPEGKLLVLEDSKTFITIISLYIILGCIAIIASFIIVESQIFVSESSVDKLMKTTTMAHTMKVLKTVNDTEESLNKAYDSTQIFNNPITAGNDYDYAEVDANNNFDYGNENQDAYEEYNYDNPQTRGEGSEPQDYDYQEAEKLENYYENQDYVQ